MVRSAKPSRKKRTPQASAALAPGETLQEAVHEIGTEEWIDAETGQPEGESPPHLRED